MGHEEVWYALMSFAVPFSFIIVFGLCLCGCRKQTPKSDLLGLAGMVKITNPDENVNNVTVLGNTPNNDPRIEDESKRLKITANPHRSLPDIPIYSDGAGDGTLTAHPGVATGDMISELYATVGDQAQRALQNSPRPRIANQNNSNRSSLHQHTLNNQTDDITSPYATVRNPDHTYNRVHVSEHPYAQLQASRTENTTENVNIGPTSSRRSSIELLQGYSDTIDGSTSTIDIPAAPAIAGRVSANQELPYMTPPIQPNTHFSGDSQDSSKGYTSISVREPLVNILAQIDQNAIRRPNRTELVDSHYATVSDDSDEMYAAIDEPFVQSDVYTSVSETYAQIQPPVENSVELHQNNIIQQSDNNSGTSEGIQNHPPNLNKDIDINNTSSVQHLTQVHSRQDSSSSCVSSVGNLGSPKPEKRQANSPLPPPPASPINFILCKPLSSSDSNKPTENTSGTARNSISDLNTIRSAPDSLKFTNSNVPQNEQDLSKFSLSELDLLDEAKTPTEITNLSLLLKVDSKLSGSIKDLEEMYAKVVKKNKNFSNFADSKIHKADNEHNSIKCGKSSNDSKEDIFVKEFCETDSDIMLEGDLRNRKSMDCSSSAKLILDYTASILNKSIVNMEKDPGYETIHDKRDTSYKDPGYETIDKNRDKNVSNKTGIPDVPERKFNISASFSSKSINHSSSNLSLETLMNDPLYESNHNTTNASSDSDPNYEVLRPPDDYSGTNYLNDLHEKQSCSDKTHGYSTISELTISNNNDTMENVAGYSVVNKNKVQNPDLNCSEHNYESLSQYYTTNSESDPNYESVEQLDMHVEPPYTRLQDKNAIKSSDENCPIPSCSNANNRSSTKQSVITVSSNKPRTEEVDDYFQV